MKLLFADVSRPFYWRLISRLGGIEHFTSLSVAFSVQDAVEKSRLVQPDAVLMDFYLPDGCSLAAIRQIHANCPQARVFMFSSWAESRRTALLSGVDDVFDKQLDFDVLVERLVELEPHA